MSSGPVVNSHAGTKRECYHHFIEEIAPMDSSISTLLKCAKQNSQNIPNHHRTDMIDIDISIHIPYVIQHPASLIDDVLFTARTNYIMQPYCVIPNEKFIAQNVFACHEISTVRLPNEAFICKVNALTQVTFVSHLFVSFYT